MELPKNLSDLCEKLNLDETTLLVGLMLIGHANVTADLRSNSARLVADRLKRLHQGYPDWAGITKPKKKKQRASPKTGGFATMQAALVKAGLTNGICS